MKGSILLISLESRKSSGLKFFKRPPTFTGLFFKSISIFEIPDTPFIQESQASDNVLPIGDNIPKPVTTTLLCSCFMQKKF